MCCSGGEHFGGFQNRKGHLQTRHSPCPGRVVSQRVFSTVECTPCQRRAQAACTVPLWTATWPCLPLPALPNSRPCFPRSVGEICPHWQVWENFPGNGSAYRYLILTYCNMRVAHPCQALNTRCGGWGLGMRGVGARADLGVLISNLLGVVIPYVEDNVDRGFALLGRDLDVVNKGRQRVVPPEAGDSAKRNHFQPPLKEEVGVQFI